MNLDETAMIISHRCDPDPKNDLRTRSLQTTLGFYSKFLPELKICVVEQDHKPGDIQHLFTNPNHSHFFIKNSNFFNRSWSLNTGYKLNFNKRYFIFSDNDILMSIESLQKVLFSIDELGLGAASPYRSALHYLTEESTVNFISNYSFDNLTYETRKINTFSGGFVIFTSDGVQKVKGWDERCVGWGCEDVIMDIKVTKLLRSGFMDYPAYHLNHNRARGDEKKNHEHFKDNYNLIIQYLKNFDESLSKSLSSDNLFS